MAEKEANGLLVIWSYTDPENRVSYQKWHNCEHMTDRVTIPGFLVGRRYNGTADAPTFMMYYETRDSKVLASEAYMRSLNNPTPWARQTIPTLKKTVRGIYTLLSSAGKKALTEAPFLLMVRFNSIPGKEKEVVQWYKEKHLPRISQVPGVHRGILYEMDDEVSNIKTEERKIHGGGPGSQKYLAIYELSELDLPSRVEWKNAYQAGGTPEFLKNMMEVLQESYWLDFVMYSPNK